MIKLWIIIIGGYTQRVGERNGTSDLWLSMRAYSSAEICVLQLAWDDDMEHLAARIRNYSAFKYRVLAAAYSWGAGYGLPRLARAHPASARCRKIDAVVCDPVHRSRLLSFRWLAFVPGMRVRLPPHVSVRQWFRQEESPFLRGHDLAHTGTADTRVPDPEILRFTHARMDDAPAYHDAVFAAAEHIAHVQQAA